MKENIYKSPNSNFNNTDDGVIGKTIPIYILLGVSIVFFIVGLIGTANTLIYLIQFGAEGIGLTDSYIIFLKIIILSLSTMTIWSIFSRKKYGRDICAFYIVFLGVLPIAFSLLPITPSLSQDVENIKGGARVVIFFIFCAISAAFYKSIKSKCYFR